MRRLWNQLWGHSNTHSDRQAGTVAATTGPLAPGRPYAREFTVSQDWFAGLGIPIATHGGSNRSSVRVRLHELTSRGSAELVFDRTLSPRSFADNEVVEFGCAPRAQSQGRSYRLEISSPDAVVGTSCTLWCALDSPPPPHSWLRRAPAPAIVMHVRHAPPVTSHALPRGLLYSPLSSCNLNCIHCISRDTRNSFARLDPAIKAKLADACAKGQIERINTDYSGDILFADKRYPGELDFLLGLNALVHIDTNGNVMNEELARRLMGARLSGLNVSLDAAEPATYARIRRGSRPLPEVLENARMIGRARRELHRDDIRLTVGISLMRSNLEEVRGLVDFVAEAGFDAVYGRHLEVYTEDLAGESLFAERERYDATRGELLAYAAARGVELALPPPFLDLEPREGHSWCGSAWDSIVLLANGDVMACCVPTTRIGSLRTQTLEEIWNGDAYQRLRQRVNSDDPPDVCKNCPPLRLTGNPTSYFFYRVKPHLEPLG